MKSLTVQTLIESGCLTTRPFVLNTDLPLDGCGISEQARRHDDDDGDGGEHDSPSLQILNAVRISLMVTRAFAHCYTICKKSSLRLDDFVVTLQCRPNIVRASPNPEEGRASSSEETQIAGGEKSLTITTVDQFNAINFTDSIQWILVDMNVNRLDERFPTEHDNIALVMQSLGKLLYAIFSPNNDVPAPEVRDSNRDRNGRVEAMRHVSKASRISSQSSFQKLIESGFPISVCRLLSDLIGRGEISTSISSFDDIIHELEHMISHNCIFLHNPEREFHTSKIHFGQRYYGRSKEMMKLLEIITIPKKENTGLEIIFVSGMSGSGKSHLVSAVGDFVSSIGCMFFSAKFKRGIEYKSRNVVSNLIDNMVSSIVQMRASGNDSEVGYSCRTADAISAALDADSLSVLVDFAPTIQSLIPGVKRKEKCNCTNRQLVFLLSKLLGAVLGQGRKFCIAFDDLQWADPATLSLLREVLCQFSEERRHLIFVGIFRDDEVSSDLESFTTSFGNVEWGCSVNVNSVKLSTLSLDDVTEMIMSELRLPRRLVAEFADMVHRRTLGHAIFVVQLLNSLVSDSTIAYSPMRHRFCWDQSKVCNLTTADSVASLIISNLTSLPEGELWCLKIISCFGIQVRSDLLEILEDFRLAPQGGFKCCICNLVDQGIVKIVSAMVVFAHDLVQEQVYEGIPENERRQLHFDIGIFLSSKTSLDSSWEHKPIYAAIDQLYLSDVRDNEDSLIPIATSQINNAGQEFFSDRTQNARFARWNIRSGKDAAEHSSFGEALYYYKNGIAFLGDELWLEDTYELCLKLHEGAALSASALGENSQVSFYTTDIINNANFEDSLLAEYLIINSLSSEKGRPREAVARGVAVLRQLDFDIPAIPSPEVVMQTMMQTERETSAYNFSEIAAYRMRVDAKTRRILELMDAILMPSFVTASPFTPLVAFASVRYSLQNGICEESASAFAILAYLQIFLKQSFELGRHWGNRVKGMLKKGSAEGQVTFRARYMLFVFVNVWYVPLQESIKHMKDIEYMSLKFGDPRRACMAKCTRYRLTFFRGEQLSTLSYEIDANLQTMARISHPVAKFSVLDKELIDSLTGNKSSNPYAVFNGIIQNKESLLAEAQSKMQFLLVQSVYLQIFFVSFWMGDYAEAVRTSDIALSLPIAKMPRVQFIYHIFYRAIISFQLYREGNGEKWFTEGNAVHDQLETWVKISKPIFENKLILLEAEHHASMCNVVAAKESYETSCQIARNNGYIHEQGLAYECMGKYLMSIVEEEGAKRCFMSAHKCYNQWGATAKANKLWKDRELDRSTESFGRKLKHQRHESDEWSDRNSTVELTHETSLFSGGRIA